MKEAEKILSDAGYPQAVVELVLSPLWPRKRDAHAEEELTRGLQAYAKGGSEAVTRGYIQMDVPLPEDRKRYK